MHKLKTFFQATPAFLYLLPVFFILHGLNDYYTTTLVKDAVELTFIYIFAAILFAAISCLYLRDFTKAALFAFFIMSINFFFGSCYDFLHTHLGDVFFLKYSFILPSILIALFLLLLFLKKSKSTFRKTKKFLNLLLPILIITDIVILVPKLINKKNVTTTDLSKELIVCDTCSKPDVYLIVADEYAGKSELTEILNFDNSAFEIELGKRGFHITDSTTSNYNATVYSMASLFSMGYVQHLDSTKINHRDMLMCRGIINRNNITNFFKKNGYTFYNHSPFQFNNQKKAIFDPFFPTKKSLFTAQTFTSRFMKNVGFNFASRQKIEKIIKHHYYNNKTIETLAVKTATTRSGPKFVYIHLALPHHPYFFDSTAKEIPIKNLTDEFSMNQDAYISYLIYTNKKLLTIIDQIKASSPVTPVIILMSDHGFRQLPVNTDHKYQFMNLNAVLLPGGNYSGFYNGISNVNQFRVILNSQFGQKLPILKDSTSFLWE